MIRQIIDINYNEKVPGELQDILERMFESLPKDRRSREYKMLRDEWNFVANIYNKKVNEKIYKTLK